MILVSLFFFWHVCLRETTTTLHLVEKNIQRVECCLEYSKKPADASSAEVLLCFTAALFDRISANASYAMGLLCFVLFCLSACSMLFYDCFRPLRHPR